MMFCLRKEKEMNKSALCLSPSLHDLFRVMTNSAGWLVFRSVMSRIPELQEGWISYGLDDTGVKQILLLQLIEIKVYD